MAHYYICYEERRFIMAETFMEGESAAACLMIKGKPLGSIIPVDTEPDPDSENLITNAAVCAMLEELTDLEFTPAEGFTVSQSLCKQMHTLKYYHVYLSGTFAPATTITIGTVSSPPPFVMRFYGVSNKGYACTITVNRNGSVTAYMNGDTSVSTMSFLAAWF
jgi:hypothetical protein